MMLILEILSADAQLGFLSESTTVLLFGAGLIASTIAVRRLLKRNDAAINKDGATGKLQDERGY